LLYCAEDMEMVAVDALKKFIDPACTSSDLKISTEYILFIVWS
jgi:hypothetical protein